MKQRKTNKHRTILGQHIGWRGIDVVVVHHLDSDRSNNDIENLLHTNSEEHHLIHENNVKITSEMIDPVSRRLKTRLCDVSFLERCREDYRKSLDVEK